MCIFQALLKYSTNITECSNPHGERYYFLIVQTCGPRHCAAQLHARWRERQKRGKGRKPGKEPLQESRAEVRARLGVGARNRGASCLALALTFCHDARWGRVGSTAQRRCSSRGEDCCPETLLLPATSSWGSGYWRQTTSSPGDMRKVKAERCAVRGTPAASLPRRRTIEQWVPGWFSFDQDTSQQGHQEQDEGSNPYDCPGTATARTGRRSLIEINMWMRGISWL